MIVTIFDHYHIVDDREIYAIYEKDWSKVDIRRRLTRLYQLICSVQFKKLIRRLKYCQARPPRSWPNRQLNKFQFSTHWKVTFLMEPLFSQTLAVIDIHITPGFYTLCCDRYSVIDAVKIGVICYHYGSMFGDEVEKGQIPSPNSPLSQKLQKRR